MGVRNRAVRERVAKAAAHKKSFDEFSASLSSIKRAVDGAIAEGATTLTPEEFGRRIQSETEGDAK